MVSKNSLTLYKKRARLRAGPRTHTPENPLRALHKSLHDLPAQLNEEVAVEGLAASQGVTLERNAARCRGKCPLHADLGHSRQKLRFIT